MTFNDEALARAVASCPVPVVTGIGHEPDTSICDMVSDRRCSTPTAAAESVAPSLAELVEVLDARDRRLRASFESDMRDARAGLSTQGDRAARAIDARLRRARADLEAAASRPCLARPTGALEQRLVELDLTADRFRVALQRSHERFSVALDALAPRLAATATGASRRAHELDLAESRLRHAGGAITRERAGALAASAGKLDALSPLKVLARGYSIAFGEDGVVSSVGSVEPGEQLRVRVSDGDIRATVTSVEHGPAR